MATTGIIILCLISFIGIVWNTVLAISSFNEGFITAGLGHSTGSLFGCVSFACFVYALVVQL